MIAVGDRKMNPVKGDVTGNVCTQDGGLAVVQSPGPRPSEGT